MQDQEPLSQPLGQEAPGEDLFRQIAAAADLCLRPHRHAVVPVAPAGAGAGAGAGVGGGGANAAAELESETGECCLRLQPRDGEGARLPADDIELEIYRSGGDLNLMLSWPERPERPLLWHGNHPVWMDGESGQRSERPAEGATLEALARRLRALLSPDR